MSRLKNRMQFYSALATLEDAGLPRATALAQRHPPPFGKAGNAMAAMIDAEGMPLASAMARLPRLFSPFECRLVEVGERTGRLALVLRALVEWLHLRQRLNGKILSGLAYPIILYHVAAVLLPLISLLTRQCDARGTALRIGVLLGVPYAGAFILGVVRPALFPNGLPLPAWFAGALLGIPLIGGIVRRVNYARFFHAYALALEAGLGAGAAVRLATGGVRNRVLASRFERTADDMNQHSGTFTAAFRRHAGGGGLDALALSLMETGEQSGTADRMAAKVATLCREDAESALDRLATVLPILVYLALALVIAWQIIRFYSGLFGHIQDLL